MKRPRISRPTISRAETATLVREIATAIEAGLPLLQALRTVRAADLLLRDLEDLLRVTGGKTNEELARFTLMTRARSTMLTDRYSERVETLEDVHKRVSG